MRGISEPWFEAERWNIQTNINKEGDMHHQGGREFQQMEIVQVQTWEHFTEFQPGEIVSEKEK